MAVSLAQFRERNPEFDETPDEMVQPRLDTFAELYSSLVPESFSDMVVYARTCLDLSQSVYGLPFAPVGLEPDKYEKRLRELLFLCHRRGTISGGGLT